MYQDQLFSGLLPEGISVYRDARQDTAPDYSIRLDKRKKHDHPEVDSVVAELSPLLEPARKPKKYRDHIRQITLALFSAWLAPGHPWTALPLSAAQYSPGTTLYRLGFSYRITRQIVDSFELQELIERRRGINYKNARYVTRIRATEKLVLLFIARKIGVRHVANCRPPIELRAPKKPGQERGDYLPPPTTKEARSIAAGVDRINAFLGKTRLSIALSEEQSAELYSKRIVLDPTATTLQRVFNDGTLSHGGRWYGHWVHRLPRDIREQTRINASPVVELDFSSLHPRILYAQAGSVPPDHIYCPPKYPYEFRPAFKILVNCLINATEQQSAWGAFRKEVREDLELLRAYGECLRDAWLKPATLAIREHHAPIAHALGSGAGVKLQRIDSDIAYTVMDKLIRRGIPSIPIHDSFMVAEQHETALHTAMESATREHLGVVIPITRKAPCGRTE